MRLTADTLKDLKIADRKGRIALGARYAGKRFALREEPDGTTVLTPVQVVPDTEDVLSARRLDESLGAIESLGDGWDGHGSPAPSREVTAYAREVLALLHAATLARGTHWTEPHIGADERGQVTLEWWHGRRSLTIFVRSGDRVDFLKAWGTDIEHEMQDGEIIRLSDFVELARWLYQENPPEA